MTEEATAAAMPAPEDPALASKSGRRKRRPRHRSNRMGKKDLSTDASRARAAKACSQIEYYFSDENLCQDVFLRSNLDSEGFIPVAVVANFPRVARLGALYEDLLAGLGESAAVEVDAENETVRPKDRPLRWVFPTPAPRWLKLQAPHEHATAHREEGGEGGLGRARRVSSGGSSGASAGSLTTGHGRDSDEEEDAQFGPGNPKGGQLAFFSALSKGQACAAKAGKSAASGMGPATRNPAAAAAAGAGKTARKKAVKQPGMVKPGTPAEVSSGASDSLSSEGNTSIGNTSGEASSNDAAASPSLTDKQAALPPTESRFRRRSHKGEGQAGQAVETIAEADCQPEEKPKHKGPVGPWAAMPLTVKTGVPPTPAAAAAGVRAEKRVAAAVVAAAIRAGSSPSSVMMPSVLESKAGAAAAPDASLSPPAAEPTPPPAPARTKENPWGNATVEKGPLSSLYPKKSKSTVDLVAPGPVAPPAAPSTSGGAKAGGAKAATGLVAPRPKRGWEMAALASIGASRPSGGLTPGPASPPRSANGNGGSSGSSSGEAKAPATTPAAGLVAPDDFPPLVEAVSTQTRRGRPQIVNTGRLVPKHGRLEEGATLGVDPGNIEGRRVRGSQGGFKSEKVPRALAKLKQHQNNLRQLHSLLGVSTR
eukprot:CAMPEP_0172601526 /NCGR_PEP_ID=MMETSP1068-20121228/21683_1 /TAXON_ID=35684 /ORGANISM="Pseudopedinella elastica, Strain CCMP716" /LENGTH=650 /DNA_ID=CAMNT_0013402537 /DNA_START=8 /DNA_END=1961 /DNA_ORIENTATION=-